jgi:hypothetical protein
LHGTIAKGTVRVLNSEHLLQVYGGCDYATGEASFEAKAWGESRPGVGGRRFDFFTSGWCIRSGGADTGCAAHAEHHTGS